jgi:hypothetical protein
MTQIRKMGLAFGRVTVYQRVRLCLNCDAVFRKNLLITFLQDRIINMVRLTPAKSLRAQTRNLIS